MKNALFAWSLCFAAMLNAQPNQKDEQERKDSLFIVEVEEILEPDKVLHAEPLFIDLIRDLGARKGEKEWNVGLGLTDRNQYDRYTALVEYEWAPVNRLGFEVELPFSFYYRTLSGVESPGSKLNSLKLASQYTFLVDGERALSSAIGYIHEFELPEFKAYSNSTFIQGHIFNPFWITAKRWGNNLHTLLYTGPVIERSAINAQLHNHWQINANLHYLIPGTRNFVGMEINKEWHSGKVKTTLRPQMRVGLADNLLVGIVTGVPLNRETERFSTFLRLIYEPGHSYHRSHTRAKQHVPAIS